MAGRKEPKLATDMAAIMGGLSAEKKENSSAVTMVVASVYWMVYQMAEHLGE